MRISLNWLKDYLDIKPEIDINQIADSLTLAGLEIEAIEQLAEHSKHLSLGVVEAVREQGERLVVDLSHNDESLTVLGQAGTLKQGHVVAFRRYSAKESGLDGVIANYGDLGLVNGAHDIIWFDSRTFEDALPANLSLVKDFDDVIFTLGITPNRADALSHLGVSRELGALLDLGARSLMLTPREMAGPTHEKVAVEINDERDCPRYACRVLENIVVGPSPHWIQLRLLAAGIRPINNVVDVTNYVMISRGQPMHAFDFDQLHRDNARAKIIVRRAQEGEKFTALDEREILLTSDDLVIADSAQVLALAGVIGARASAVSQQTSTVLLESAYFEPTHVRMTARRHGITTESSYRFERGADPNGVVDALNYAARLLTEISDAKVCREPIDAYRKRIDPIELKMRPDRARAVLGMSHEAFDQDLLRKRFLRLGIETIAKRGDAIYFRVPTHRSDITREIDLIEEAARMIGFDKVSEANIGPALGVDQFCNQKLESVADTLVKFLASRGFSEAINYAFLNKEFHNLFVDESKPSPLELVNPLSDRYGVMRQTLIPGLIKNVLHNQRNQEKSTHFFEIGTVFLELREEGSKPNPTVLSSTLDQDSYSIERQMLSGVMGGKTMYNAFDQPDQIADFYHLKGVLSESLHLLGFSDQFPNANIVFEHGTDALFLHPGESATIKVLSEAKDSIIGRFGTLHPSIANKLDVQGSLLVFDLFLDRIASHSVRTKKFRPFSRFPTVERDVAFLVKEDVRVHDLLQSVASIDRVSEMLSSMRVFDVYRGKNIEAGMKSVAITLCLQREDRTLTDEEVDAFMNQFIVRAHEATGARVR